MVSCCRTGFLELDEEIKALARERIAIEPLVAEVTSAITAIYHNNSAAIAANRAEAPHRLSVGRPQPR
jgi:hypothetical protein